MKTALRRFLVGGLAGTLAITQPGCTLPQYQRKSGPETSPVPLDLRGEAADISARVEAVIVHGSPGSWKAEAWWDEYIITLSTREGSPVTVTSIELENFAGERSSAATDPWQLERESQRWWQTTSARSTGYVLALGAGAATVAAVAYGSVLLGSASLGTAAAATAAAAVAVPVVVVGSLLTNVHHRELIEREFHRRRHALPRSLAAGERATGSCFFRVSPGPRYLHVHYRQGGIDGELPVPLAPLGGLHFQRRDYSLDAPTPPVTK